jgi:ADP-heptose:LPS heptosyltransferase
MERNDYFSIRWQLFPLFLRLFFRKPACRSTRPITSVVCLRPGKLGDMIVATPLFSALKKQGGVERLAVLCSAVNEEVIRLNPNIDIIKPVNFHRVSDVLRATGWLRRQHFDAIIDLTPGFSRTNFIMSRYAGPGIMRAGIEKEHLADRYDVHIGGRESHLADRMLAVGEMLTGRKFSEARSFEIFTALSDREAAAQCIRRCTAGGPIIAINLSAGNERRQWPYERFAALITGLSKQKVRHQKAHLQMALIAMGEQRKWAEKMAAGITACVAVPECSFLTVTEIIGSCALLVSPDTACIHAAAARGVPVVGLYTANNENFVRWGPYHVKNRIVRSSNMDTLDGIEPEQVCRETIRLLEETGKP